MSASGGVGRCGSAFQRTWPIVWWGGGDSDGVAPLEDSGTDLEDELPKPDGGSPYTDVGRPVLGSTSPGIDLELARALLELGVLPAMVMPIVDPEVGRTTGGGDPVRVKSLLCQVSPPGSVSEPVPSPISPLLRSADVVSPPSVLVPMDQYLPWSASLPLGVPMDSPLMPAPLTPRRIIEELVSGSVVASLTREASVAVAQPRMPDLSWEGPL